MKIRFLAGAASTVALILFVTAAIPVSARQQQTKPNSASQDQSIQLKTNLIQLRAVVTDKKGNVVDGLKKEDFEVLDNGSPQDIGFFSVERVPVGGVSQPGITTQPTTVTRPQAATPSRSIVLFVDTLHLTFFSLARAKQQLKLFIDSNITDRDLVAVVTTGRSLGVLQQFMKDKKMLKYAVDKISLQPEDSSSFTPYLAAQVLSGDPSAINLAIAIVSEEEGYKSLDHQAAVSYVQARATQILGYESNLRKATLLTLGAVSKRLGQMRGERMIALVSDGFTLLEDGAPSDDQDMNEVISQAARAGVVIYSFYGKGLEAPAETNASTRMGGVDFSRYMADSALDSQSVLRTVAAETGGEAYMNHNYISGPLQKMLENNSVYYSIAYYEPDDRNSTKFRKVSIRIKGHPEYTVRAQRGYLPFEQKKEEVASSPQQKLFDDMISPLPVTTIGVTSACDFLEVQGDDSQATLMVHIDGNTLRYQKDGDNYRLDCEIAMAIFDSSGKLASTPAQEIKSTLTPKQLETAKFHGYRYTKRLDLKPGLYQIRVGVREVDSGLIGTSMSWVEIPDLHKGKLALSDIFLGKSTPAPTEGAKPAGASSRAEMMIGSASYKQGDFALYRFVAYNVANAEVADKGATLKVELLDGAKTIYSSSEPLASRTIRKDAKGIEVGGRLKLSLPPGFYTLRISVRDTRSKKAAVATTAFDVES